MTIVGLIAGGLLAMGGAEQDDREARELVQLYETRIRPVEIELGLAWWKANITGTDEAYQHKTEVQKKLDRLLSDRETFARLKRLVESGRISDPVLRRQVEVMYLTFLPKQLDPELLDRITEKENAVERAFNVFRPVVDGKQLTDNQVREILRESTDSELRRKAWEASKAVGRVVEKDLLELVALRNEAARRLGFRNFHDMMLVINEQDPEQIMRLFDELDEMTREPFAAVKAEIDRRLARMYGIRPEELRPWHYHDPFFQEAPNVFSVDLDEVYRYVNIVDVCRRFFAGIDLNVDDVLDRSDLYEKPGKSPHAFCIDVDREGDVRVLANVVPSERWMETMLHELGHAVYSKYVPRSLPYLLRTESHILTTEGIAMMFGRLSKRRAWLEQMGILPEHLPEGVTAEELERAGDEMLRYQMLIFSRWTQVMLRFERELYSNPDQNLNSLWWKLVARYQLVTPPEGRDEPDYASKIHVVSAPAYYHNYQMGEMFASQVHRAMAAELAPDVDPTDFAYVGNPGVGKFLRERVFAYGRLLKWNELTEKATGKPLGAEAFTLDIKERGSDR